MTYLIRFALSLTVLLTVGVGVVIAATPHLTEGHMIACRVEAQPMNATARERGWYLVDYRRQVLSSQRLNAFPYPFMFVSPDFTLGITEGIWDETIQPELFLHRNHFRFRRNTPITEDNTDERFIGWSPDNAHILYNRLDRSGRGLSGLYTLNVHTEATERLTDKLVLDAIWSADGAHVFYYVSFEKGYDIMHLASGEREHVSDYVGAPYDWSPDDDYVLLKGEKQKTGIKTPHFIVLNAVTGEKRVLRLDAPPTGTPARSTPMTSALILPAGKTTAFMCHTSKLAIIQK